MIVQEILTYATVAGAFVLAGRGIFRTFFPAPGQSPCSGCASSGCEVKSLLVNKVYSDNKNGEKTNYKELKISKS